VDDHNDIGDEEDRGLGEGVLHVEEMICNKDVPDVLLQSTNKKGFDNLEMFDRVSRVLLYKECKGCDKEYTLLWMTLELLKLNANNGWSDTSVLYILHLVAKMLPKLDAFPTNTYLAKELICPLTIRCTKNSYLLEP
jgi:hypothetical protein